MNRRILLVDDEPKVLSGYVRALHSKYEFETAESGPLALNKIVQSEPFAVVVTDMRMPQMNGIQLLTEVRKVSPDTVRIMLTGNADIQTCIDAVNEGHIFRFLTKPCTHETLSSTLNAGLEYFRLINAEHELLQETLTGAITMLTDLLSMVYPGAITRGIRIRRYVRHMAVQLGASNHWQYELAATLSQIGVVALPPEILSKISTGGSMNQRQRESAMRHPEFARRLLAHIPRLDLVAKIIEKQNETMTETIIPVPDMSEEAQISFGAQLIKMALDLDKHLMRGYTMPVCLAELQSQYGTDHPLIDALMSFEGKNGGRIIIQTYAKDAVAGMLAHEDIIDISGRVLISKGQEITNTVLLYLQGCAEDPGLKEPFLVEAPEEAS